MNTKFNSEKLLNLIFIGAGALLIFLLADFSLLTYGFVPVMVTIFALREGRGWSLGLLSVLLGLCLLFFEDLDLAYSLTFSLALPLLWTLLFRRDYEDKRIIGEAFFFLTLLALFLYELGRELYGLGAFKNFEEMAEELSSADLPIKAADLKTALNFLPVFLEFFLIFYQALAVKVIRNYLAYKDPTIPDSSPLREVHLTRKDLAILVAFGAVYSIILYLVGFSLDFVGINGPGRVLVALAVYGLLVVDDIVGGLFSGLVSFVFWLIIFSLFFELAGFFAIYGLLDIFLDFRSKWRKNFER